ncbi:MAG: hypothetical protein BJBARM4_0896 [Candidatus Parvarchaeum acidiphilum ARMAN-4]|jgi:hypothetical protein|uniref:Uncharacterized protein n=1 Tax=Candidatus Parvarchaeum acidiphilum ARMAN-4 TaxID=662760 RepID=D2EGJ7_PARA4|nr:MAG: hypothetical protein BJBARM4_0896 [Candidatus Parvarchaeum acidiphilum ARMAN-4]
MLYFRSFFINSNGVNAQDYGTASSVMGLANRLAQTSSGLSGYLMDVSLPFPVLLGHLSICRRDYLL